MASRLMQLVIESPDLGEPFGPAAVAEETNRRFASRLRNPVGPRAASDVLRRMVAAGEIELVREGKAFHEAMYRRKARRR